MKKSTLIKTTRISQLKDNSPIPLSLITISSQEGLKLENKDFPLAAFIK